MPDKEETLAESNARHFKEGLEKSLEDIIKKRDTFERDFERNYLRAASVPECDKILNENNISKKEQKGIEKGYNDVDFKIFKEATRDQEVHDIRGMKLSDDEITALRATEYKKVFDKNVDNNINKCKENMQELIGANAALQNLESEREPLYNTIAQYESEIADLEIDWEITEEDKKRLSELRIQRDKSQKEYDNFFESDPKKKEAYQNAKENVEKKRNEFDNSLNSLDKCLGPRSSEKYISSEFLKGFVRYEKTTKEMSSFLNGEPKVKEAKKEVKQSQPKVSRTANAENQKEKNTEEKQTTEAKAKLDKYSRDCEKFAKKSWFARLFDRKGKADLARQRNELKQHYRYTDTQLDIAKLGSRINAKQLEKIMKKAEKVEPNASAIDLAIRQYKIGDAKLIEKVKQFTAACKTTGAPVQENKAVNRKSIVVNEAKDEKQSQKINVAENSKSLNLQKEKESNML